ncbi:ABC transporter substrate-binding protein [Promicromonospora sp. NPDC050880]|uniref:ABC transporter substrate-binding protein n=1 Tax=Promicromonospora sp. NPDC050880 TaxID=3364406 RepID=UPI0037A841A3
MALSHGRTRRRARIASVGALAATALALAGCGAGADIGGAGIACDIDQPDSPTTVNVLSYTSPSSDPFADAIVNGCTGENLTVEAPETDFAGQDQRAVQSMSSSRPSYDIVEVYGTVYPLYSDRGWITPLDDYVADQGDELGLDDIDPALLESLSYDGQQMALPTFWGTVVFVYRADIFEDLGLEVPTTFEEMFDAAETITQETGMEHPLALPIASAGDVSSVYNQILGSLGGQWFDGDQPVPTLDSPESVEALDTLRTTYENMSPQSTSWASPEVISQLQTGQAAMSFLFAGRVSALLDEEQTEHAGSFGFDVPPAVQEGGTPATSLSVDGLAIAENSEVDKDLLFDLIGVATGPEAAAEAAGATIPARTTEAQAADLPFEPAARAVLEGERPNALPLVPWMSDVFAVAAPVLNEVVSGDLSSEEGAAQLQQAAEKAIDDAGYGS